MRRVVVCGTQKTIKAVAPHLRGLCTVVDGWNVEGGLPNRAHIVVVCAETIGENEERGIDRLVRSHPLSHFVLVTGLTGQNVRVLTRFPSILRRLVGLDELSSLRPSIEDILSRHFLDRGAHRLGEIRGLPPAVVRFVQCTWLAGMPPRSVAEACREIRVSRSTLRDAWCLDEPPSGLVEWGLVGRALSERQRGRSWSRSALAVRVTVRRLGRMALRRLGCGLDKLDKQGPDWVEQEFERWFVALASEADREVGLD
jgi:hypothetical protein